MKRADYFRLVAEIADRWPNGEWSDTLIEKWWNQFQHIDVQYAVRAVRRLEAEGHGPFVPDPGLVLRYALAASPGGGRRPVGAHADRLALMAETAASPEDASAAISRCRQLVAEARADAAEIAAETSAQRP